MMVFMELAIVLKDRLRAGYNLYILLLAFSGRTKDTNRKDS